VNRVLTVGVAGNEQIMKKRSLGGVAAVAVSFASASCSETGLDFRSDLAGAGGEGWVTSGAMTGTGSGGAGTGSANKGGTVGVDMDGGANDADSACGSGDQPAQMTPVYMVFLYDKSGSMGDDPNGQWQNQATRWDPMKLGMIDFFSHSGSIGIAASLKFFPAPGDKATTCHADYKTATLVPLEAPQPLIDALQSTTPGGGTPTLPAVIGGIGRAKQLMTDNPGSKAVVVLVTDGEPAIYNAQTSQIEVDCAPLDSSLTNTIADIVTVVNAAKRGTPSIPTYVIGIGEAQDSMNAIATAGGTGKMIQLDASKPPEQTRAMLTESLRQIRTTQFECSMALPTSADYDRDHVNVRFQHSDGSVEELGKSVGCAAPGWYFDNDGSPTKILLCPATCSSIQSDLNGKLLFTLGCPTKIV
jgi:hypothetical protein